MRGNSARAPVSPDAVQHKKGDVMSLVSQVFPPIDDALVLEPEELAVSLIECLCKPKDDPFTTNPNKNNFTQSHNTLGGGHNKYQGKCSRREKPHAGDKVVRQQEERNDICRHAAPL